MRAPKYWFNDETTRRRISVGGYVLSAVALLLLFYAAFALDNSRRIPAADRVVVPAPTATSVPTQTDGERLRAALLSGQPVTLVGVGSSVGLGATLPDPATEAPVGRLTELIRTSYPDVTATASNLSVNGSVASEGLTVYRDEGRALAPTVVVVAFGMNDGLPGAYSSGQTFPGGITAIRALVEEAHRDGAAVILLTTPSPHTGRQSWNLPTSLPLLFPEPDEDVISIDGAPFSARHADFNRELRVIAETTGALLGDAEKYWATLLVSQGEDALFDEAEFAHLNILGHEESYWKAFDAFMRGLQAPPVSAAVPRPLTQVLAVKASNAARTSTTVLADDEQLSFAVGAGQVWQVEADVYFTAGDGDLRVGLSHPAATTGSISVIGAGVAATTFTSDLGTVRRVGLPDTYGLPVGGNGADASVRVSALVRTTAAGQVTMQFSQDVSSATTTTIYADSFLRATRVA